MIQSLNLLALSRYCHYLNESASGEAIRQFHAKPLDERCAIAEAWTDGVDIQADQKLAEENT